MNRADSKAELIVLENTEHGHNKFWECERMEPYRNASSERLHTIRWGKIGNNPQDKHVNMTPLDRQDRVEQKLREGYVMVFAGPRSERHYQTPRNPAKPTKAPEGKVIISVLKRAAHANAS